MSNLKMTKT